MITLDNSDGQVVLFCKGWYGDINLPKLKRLIGWRNAIDPQYVNEQHVLVVLLDVLEATQSSTNTIIRMMNQAYKEMLIHNSIDKNKITYQDSLIQTIMNSFNGLRVKKNEQTLVVLPPLNADLQELLKDA